MEELAKQVDLLVQKTVMEQDPKLKQEADELDNWMQQSQPQLSDSDYSSNGEQETTKDLETVTEVGQGEAEKNPDFFPTEKSIAKRKKVRYTATRIRYSPTRVKSRNFLSNIGYNSINKADFYNEKFHFGRLHFVGQKPKSILFAT